MNEPGQPEAIMTDCNVELKAMDRKEFCARFKAHMLKLAGQPEFGDGGSIAEYADQAAPTYWEDALQRAEGPEECAAADVSYWGDE